MLKLNLKANDYPIALNQELNEAVLKEHSFRKIGLFDRLFLKPSKDQIVWWAKNCGLRYLNEELGNAIYPILDTKAGADIMFGTSAYLWFQENKLIRLTYQIIQNKMAAEISLKRLEEKIIETFGEPASSESPFVAWETEEQKLILEYPQRIHGYIHLMNKNLII